MTLNLILIRHGESVANLSPEIISGLSAETPLTEKGKLQAYQLRQYFMEQRHLLSRNGTLFDKVYASPTRRTKQTAEIACERLGVNIEYSERLFELSQGDWVGRVREEVITQQLRELRDLDPLNFKAPNGESPRELEQRAFEFLEKDLNYREATGTVAVFGHAYHFKCLLRGIMNFDPHFTWKVNIDNTGMTGLRYEKDGWRLQYLNATPHL